MDMTAFTSKKFLIQGLISLILFILFATLPLYGSSYMVILWAAIIMYIVLTVSWAFFSGPTGYLSLATAAFFGVGIYTTAYLGKVLPLIAVVVAGGVVCFVFALIVGAITLRLRGIYFAIFTFGLVELIRHVLLFWEITVMGTRGRFVVLVDNNTIYYVIFGILVLLLLTVFFIRRSKFGLAMQSIGDNEDAAAQMGVNVTLVKIITFAVSAFFMGAAGAIMATRWTYIDPYVGFNPLFSFLPVLMAIFGGLGQVYGPIIGAAIFAYLEELLLTKFPYYYMLIFGIVLVVVVLYLPDGLIGLIQRARQRWQKGGLTGEHANT
jgi:branched-chain amino acid transport system permease protein